MRTVLVLLALAATLQLAMLGGFVWLWESAYGEPRRLAESWEGPLTATGLALGGPVAFLAAVVAFHRSLRLPRARWTSRLLATLAIPSLLLGALATHVILCLVGVW